LIEIYNGYHARRLYNLHMQTIIHLDLDAFFCAVEERQNPALSGKSFAVGGSPEGRGVVASCSYAARAHGVHSAMSMKRAKLLCPSLIVLNHHRGNYRQASHHVVAILRKFTNLIEQVSIDEAFLDVSFMDKTREDIGRMIQTAVNENTKLPCSLGIASNKLTAKIANDYGKKRYKGTHYPNAITVVPPGRERAFLAPLPLPYLWGVGEKTAARLAAHGVGTIGDLAEIPLAQLSEWLGVNAGWLHKAAQGIDDRAVVAEESQAKSISNEITFDHDTTDTWLLDTTIESIAKGLARRLIEQRLRATVIKVKIRWSDFTTLTKQTTVTATDDYSVLAEIGKGLLHSVWNGSQPVRLIGLGVSGIVKRNEQLALWDQEVEKNQNLADALFEIEDRFGKAAIRFGKHREREENDPSS
jgi:DNA polymerase IV